MSSHCFFAFIIREYIKVLQNNSLSLSSMNKLKVWYHGIRSKYKSILILTVLLRVEYDIIMFWNSTKFKNFTLRKKIIIHELKLSVWKIKINKQWIVGLKNK